MVLQSVANQNAVGLQRLVPVQPNGVGAPLDDLEEPGSLRDYGGEGTKGEREADIEGETQTQTYIERDRDRQTDRQRETYRQTDKQGERETYRET